MSLWANLRVLCGSPIGSQVLQLRERLEQIEFEQDRQRDIAERRFRSLRKRQKDEEVIQDARDPEPEENGSVARLRARRAARNLRSDQGRG